MDLTPEIKTSIGNPSDILQWNALCFKMGNLQQSTYYDAVQAYFRQHPLYLEIWSENQLLGGTKIYVYIPGKLSRLTSPFGKYFLQAGECIIPESVDTERVLPLIHKAFADILKKNDPVWYTSYGYFDKPNYLILPENKPLKSQTLFANAFIPLNNSLDTLWNNIHPHHQQKILKAEKRGYKVEQISTIQTFLNLLSTTYSNQSHTGPNPAFIQAFYRIMVAEGHAAVYVSHKDGKYFSSALVTTYGPVAYYAFGGNERNNDGASHLLHWEVIKTFADKNFSQYYLGQVAVDEQSGDEKFLQGISPFKRRFGTTEVINSRKTFIFKPYSYQLWKLISPLAGTR